MPACGNGSKVIHVAVDRNFALMPDGERWKFSAEAEHHKIAVESRMVSIGAMNFDL